MSLSSNISDRMMIKNDYVSPSLVGLDDKKVQLRALQVVKEGSTRQHKELNAEDKGIDKKLKLMLKIS